MNTGSTEARESSKIQDVVAQKTVSRTRKRMPLLALTATGPVYSVQAKAVVLPVGVSCALLQELAMRAMYPDAQVVSSLAKRVEGRTAYDVWVRTSVFIAGQLSNSDAKARLAFLQEVVRYVGLQQNTNGIEPTLCAAINATWNLLNFDTLQRVINLATTHFKSSKFAQSFAIPVVDPSSRTVTIVEPGGLTIFDVSKWLDRRALGVGQGLWAEQWGDLGSSGFDWGNGTGGTGLGGVDRNWGSGTGGGIPGGLGGEGSNQGGLPGGFGTWGNGTGGTGLGGVDRNWGSGTGGGIPGGLGGEGSNQGGSLGGFGTWGNGTGGAGLGGVDRNWGSGTGGGIPGGGAGTGSDWGGMLGGAGRSPNSSGLGKNGGPFGFGAGLGRGGASTQNDADKSLGASLISVGQAVAAAGGAGVFAGALAAGLGNPAGFGVIQGGVLAGGIGGILVVTGLVIQYGADKAKPDTTATGQGSGKPASEPEKAPPPPKDQPQEDDDYPDPEGDGGQELPDDRDGNSGGNPKTIWDENGGGGNPNTIWDENGGGGNPNTIWDEGGGGVSPTTKGKLIASSTVMGKGLLAGVIQIGPSNFSF